MKVRVQKGKLEKFAGDLLVVKWVMGQKMDGSTGAVDRVLRGALGKMIKEEGFKGKEGEVMVFPTLGKIPAKKVMVLGLGEQKNITPELIRKSAARIVKEARRQKAKKVGTIFIGTGSAGIDPFIAAKAMTEGALLGAYVYHKYKSEEAREEAKFPQELVIVTSGMHERAVLHNSPQPPLTSDATVRSPTETSDLRGGEKWKIREAERGIKEGEVYAQATIFARELVNEPASNMVPKTLADAAVKIVKEAGGVVHNPSSPPLTLRGGNKGGMEVKILNRAQCEKMGMGAYLGVAKGSDHEPYFIHLVYRPAPISSSRAKRSEVEGSHTMQGEEISPLASQLGRNDGVARIAIVGKGITFDSGGLSLKPAQYMETMKLDMAGCAAMLGVFHALAKLKPNVEVHGISPVCENMPSGRAMKPGDIVRTMNGKTIEILNTDAEGRLALADALAYTVKHVKPDAIVDLATLTGACVVALGEEVAGYMGNDRALLDRVKDAAQAAGERVWELPLVPEYKEFIKSHVADYCNIHPGKKGAGAIMGGLLLQEFVGKIPWVHLDIAGPAWAEKEVIPYMPKGGTGFGVRMMLEFLWGM